MQAPPLAIFRNVNPGAGMLSGMTTDTLPASDSTPRDAPPAALALALTVLARCGQGLWLLLGLALATGMYRAGRGETLVPLLIGATFVGTGLLAALLRLPGTRHWYGWQPGDGRPTAAALLALTSFLPMLGVVALARDGNTFWATRIAATLLVLCSAGSLLGQPSQPDARNARVRLDRLVEGLFTGGLWLWACVLAQAEPAGTQRPVAVALLVLALLLGLLESLRWHALRARRTGARAALPFAAATLVYAIPGVLLLCAAYLGHAFGVAALAGSAALAGRVMEQYLYREALLGMTRTR